MNITYNELRRIKHSLPTGSISRIASELGMDEQVVRNYFGGGHETKKGEQAPGVNYEPGPDGGVVHLEDTRVLEVAQRILGEHHIQN
jgi:predicted transcriptional regulator